MSITFGALIYFDDDRIARDEQRDDFLSGDSGSIIFNYPKLDDLFDDLAEQKHAAERAMRVAGSPELAATYARTLASINLVEAAKELKDNDTPENRAALMDLNEKIFGPFHSKLFQETIDGTFVKYLDHDLIEKLHQVTTGKFTDLLSKIPNSPDDIYYDAPAIVHIADACFAAQGLAEKGWRAEISPDKFVPTDDSENKLLHIPITARRNANELRRLLIHEIGVHAERAQNGVDSGDELLKIGTADYLPAEEGLGILLECAVNGDWHNPSLSRAIERYIVAGYALGADGKKTRNAPQTFEASWPEIAKLLADFEGERSGLIDEAKKKTYAHLENAFRGTNLRMPGIIFLRLKIYYEGLIENIECFKRHEEDLSHALDEALRGKYDHTKEKEAA